MNTKRSKRRRPSLSERRFSIGSSWVLSASVARRRTGAAVLDALAVLAFVTPAVLLGIGLIAVWKRPALAFVYGGIGMIVVGYIGRYAVVGLRTLNTIIAQTISS